jgi:hypothetical protein
VKALPNSGLFLALDCCTISTVKLASVHVEGACVYRPTIREVNQHELPVGRRFLEPLEPQFSRAFCLSSNRHRSVRRGGKKETTKLAVVAGDAVPMEHDPLRDSHDGILGVVQRR